VFLECEAPRAVLLKRAARRTRSHNRVSDADVAIVMRERQAWDPLDEVAASAHVALRTDRSIDEIVGDVLALLDRRLLALG
jgi:predicted kinase